MVNQNGQDASLLSFWQTEECVECRQRAAAFGRGVPFLCQQLLFKLPPELWCRACCKGSRKLIQFTLSACDTTVFTVQLEDDRQCLPFHSGFAIPTTANLLSVSSTFFKQRLPVFACLLSYPLPLTVISEGFHVPTNLIGSITGTRSLCV